MKHSHMIMIALAALGLLAAVLLMPKHTAENADRPPPTTDSAVQAEKAEPQLAQPQAQQLPQPQLAPPPAQDMRAALLIDGQPVDPLCFLNRAGEGEDAAFKLTDCRGPYIMPDTETEPPPLGPDFISLGYSAVIPDDESGSQDRYPGFVGYRYLGDLDGHKAIWLVESGGGSGVFTTLMLVDYEPETKQLVPQEIVAVGDRCNGGIAAADLGENMLVYERDVTPYEMLSLVGDPAREILASEAAEEIPFCSICCYGRAQYAGGAFRGVRFDERLLEAIAVKTYPDNAGAEKCFDELVTLYVGDPEDGKIFFDAEAFASFITAVENTCLKRTGAE